MHWLLILHYPKKFGFTTVLETVTCFVFAALKIALGFPTWESTFPATKGVPVWSMSTGLLGVDERDSFLGCCLDPLSVLFVGRNSALKLSPMLIYMKVP